MFRSSPALRLVAPLGLLLAACAADPSPVTRPAVDSPAPEAPSVASPAAPQETCLLGRFEVQIQSRMVQDDGVTALLEDQRIGAVPLLFAAQRRLPRVPAPPRSNLMLTRGAVVSEELEDLEYVASGTRKPTETRMVRKPYTYFLAEAAWDCEPAAAEIEALGLPKGQAGAEACVPAEVRARCLPLELSPTG